MKSWLYWGLLFVLIVAMGVIVVLGRQKISQKASYQQGGKVIVKETVEENPQKLQVEDLVIGTGAEAVNGREIVVHYTGTLTDGKKFDSSLDRQQPFKFVLGAGQVIAGWDQGVLGMKVGGKRKLIIPPELGYGVQGAPPNIPPNATLIFEVELLEVR